MARPITAAELAVLLSAHPNHYLRVMVANASGTLKNMSSLEGVDWVDGCSISCEELDSAVATATVTLRQTGVLAKGLSPLLVNTINVDDTSAYAPLLYIGRTIVISFAAVALGATPGAGDWHELLHGRIDQVAWQSDPITLTCSDDGSRLMTTQIEDARVYGSVGGTEVQQVMQDLLTDWPSGVIAVPTLYAPVSPGWAIGQYKQDRVKVLEALRALAQQIGWDCYYRYDDAGVSRLTLWEPDRGKTVPDFTIGPTQYTDVTNLTLSLESIRNVVKVLYTPAGSGALTPVVRSDADSIALHGRLYFEVAEAASSNIDSWGEADAMAAALLHDVAAPPLEQEVAMLLFWPAQKGDLILFHANGVHYTNDQKLAVVGLRHDFANGTGITTLKVRGSVAGAYAEWIRKGGTNTTAAGEIYDIEWTRAGGVVTVTFKVTPAVAEVWKAARAESADASSPDWAAVKAAVAALDPGATSFTFPDVEDGEIALVQMEARHADLSTGDVHRFTVTAAGQMPAEVPDDLEWTDGTTATQYLKLVPRGVPVTSVVVQLQVGSNPLTDFAVPLRGVGDTSVLYARPLVEGEWEQDVLLDPTKFSWVIYKVTLQNGTVFTRTFGFDRDKRPNILRLDVVGTRIDVLGDSDTSSIRITKLLTP